MAAERLIALDYEIHGKVQKVFFRKHTHEHAQSLGLRGWVMNTAHGTVVGQLEGPEAPVVAMKAWLEKVGSPKSVIDRAEFKNEREIGAYTFESFELRR